MNETETDAASACPAQHHDAQLDFSADMSYGDYLHLDAVLNAQQPLSPDHNEMQIGRASCRERV